MSLIHITGPTGSGKSTVREKPAALGYETYDVDDEGMRESTLSDNGKLLLTLKASKLDELKERAEKQTVFILGV